MRLSNWLKSGMSDEDYQIFLRQTHEKERAELLYVSSVGSLVFLLWGIFDYYVAPAHWAYIFLVRVAIIVPYMAYNATVAVGLLSYNSITKLINSLPAAYYTSYLVTIVPTSGFYFYAFPTGLILIAVGSARIWKLWEFAIFSAAYYAPSFVIWALATSLTFTQVLFLNFLVLTSLMASFGSALNKHSFMARLHKQKIDQLAQDSAILDNRLKTAARTAYQAEYLGLFLHEMKNVLHHIQLISEVGEMEPHTTTEVMATLKSSSTFARTKIEAFMDQMQTGKATREILRLKDEIEAVEDIANYEVRHKTTKLTFEYFNVDKDSRIWAIRGSIPSILFNLIRNSVAAIGRMEKNSEKGKYKGAIVVTATVTDVNLVVKVDDNGDTVTNEFLEAYNSGQYARSAALDRMGIGTYAMRVEAKANGGTVEIKPREGGGTTAILTIPLRETVEYGVTTEDAVEGALGNRRAS